MQNLYRSYKNRFGKKKQLIPQLFTARLCNKFYIPQVDFFPLWEYVLWKRFKTYWPLIWN